MQDAELRNKISIPLMNWALRVFTKGSSLLNNGDKYYIYTDKIRGRHYNTPYNQGEAWTESEHAAGKDASVLFDRPVINRCI